MPAKKSIKKELTKFLKHSSKEELEKEIKKLYDKFKAVKQYYELEFAEDSTAVLDEFKAKLRKEYFPSRGYGQGRNSISRKVVSEFKKIAIFKKDVIDLLLYRVEVMLEFTNTYGDIDEAFYNSLTRSFDEACKLIQKEQLREEYKIHCQELMNEAYNFGWGVYDSMKYSYQQYLAFI